MFLDLKEVLNLNRLYAANPNAVAMQVYAAAIVYTAMRIAQSEAAAQPGLPPEELSPTELFPKIAVASFLYLQAQAWERQWQRRHPGAHPHCRRRRPRWARADPGTVRLEQRSDVRRRRRFCSARAHWKSLRHVRSGPRPLAKLT